MNHHRYGFNAGLQLYRCVICWAKTPWWKGCADAVDEVLVPAATAFVDGDDVSDGSICDDCWHDLGGAQLTATIEAA